MKPRITIDKEEYDKLVAMQPEKVTTTWHLDLNDPIRYARFMLDHPKLPYLFHVKCWFDSKEEISVAYQEKLDEICAENKRICDRGYEVWLKLRKAENMSWFDRVFRYKETLSKL